MISKILKFKQVSSTQDVLKKFVDNNKEMAVFAYHQTRGRGRQKRYWYSPSGGLYLSILVFPKKEINALPLIAALAVIETLKDLKFTNLTVHWPNDVMLNNKKVCGILCEKQKDAVICGIGLNINVKKFPKKLERATSLFLESRKIYNIEELFDLILKKFDELYEKLQHQEIKINEIYHYVSGIGEPVEIKLSSKEILKGTIYDIDRDWGLLVRTADGFIKKIYYGDVLRLV